MKCRMYGGPLNSKSESVHEGEYIKSYTLERRDILGNVLIPAQFHEYKKTNFVNDLGEMVYEYMGSYNAEIVD